MQCRYGAYMGQQPISGAPFFFYDEDSKTLNFGLAKRHDHGRANIGRTCWLNFHRPKLAG